MQELEAIKRRLKEFEKQLYASNYECHFMFTKICDGTDIKIARSQIKNQFGLSLDENQNLVSVEYNSFIKDVSEKLCYRGDQSAGVSLTSKQEAKFDTKLGEFLSLLNQKFNPRKTDIYIHPEIITWIFWGFCFLLVSKEKNAIYLF